MSMAHYLEFRCPLLDYRILELAAKLPARLKIRGVRGTQLLRRVAARRLAQALGGPLSHESLAAKAAQVHAICLETLERRRGHA